MDQTTDATDTAKHNNDANDARELSNAMAEYWSIKCAYLEWRGHLLQIYAKNNSNFGN
jgi:hypothetical protein